MYRDPYDHLDLNPYRVALSKVNARWRELQHLTETWAPKQHAEVEDEYSWLYIEEAMRMLEAALLHGIGPMSSSRIGS